MRQGYKVRYNRVKVLRIWVPDKYTENIGPKFKRSFGVVSVLEALRSRKPRSIARARTTVAFSSKFPQKGITT